MTVQCRKLKLALTPIAMTLLGRRSFDLGENSRAHWNPMQPLHQQMPFPHVPTGREQLFALSPKASGALSLVPSGASPLQPRVTMADVLILVPPSGQPLFHHDDDIPLTEPSGRSQPYSRLIMNTLWSVSRCGTHLTNTQGPQTQ